jgi:hypothetical protein
MAIWSFYHQVQQQLRPPPRPLLPRILLNLEANMAFSTNISNNNTSNLHPPASLSKHLNLATPANLDDLM